MIRFLVRAAVLIVLAAILLLAIGYSNATADPIVREAKVQVADWPEGAPPFTVLAISDIHVAGPDMPPERLARIAKELNALEPDLVVVAGDLVSEKRIATRLYSPDEVADSFAEFKATHDVLVVPGNHEHWAGLEPIVTALEEAGIAVAANEAVVRGPLRVAAIDDHFTDHDDVPATFASLDALDPGPTIVVTHSPDVIPELPRSVDAVFAGHTHCGQISLPVLGPVAYMSRFGERYACGDIEDEGQRVFVTAGLGTSLLPLRFGAPPDVWLVTFEPAE